MLVNYKKMKRYNNLDIFKGRTKEWDSEMGKFRQYRSRQGRSDKQYESSMKVMAGVCILFLVTIVCYGIVNTIINVLG